MSAEQNKNITALHMNNLHGRMLHLPAKGRKNREILLLYGQHASLERMRGIAEVLNRYGAVTVPDLPGFGGMDSFYKIDSKPTLDNYADYLAAFIKLRYKRRKVAIVAMSFSFLVVTRMLQRYPELTKKVDLLISFVGFLHRDDFHVKPSMYWSWRAVSRLFGGRFSSAFARHVVLKPWNIRLAYRLVASRHPKLKDAAKHEQAKRVNFEIGLWQLNDVRTRMKTLAIMCKADLCGKSVKMPVHHVSVAGDFYFDNKVVEQHMRIVYSDFENIPAGGVGAHAPTVIATAKEAAPFIPPRLRRLLSQ